MDLIERQTAIEAIAYSIELCNKALDSMTLGGRDRYAVEVERNSLLKLKDDFKLLPSAQPERKPGKWELLPISTITPVYKCSVCGRHAVWITTGCLVNRHEESYLSDFCPNCGADMKGEQDERHDL